jgi:murein DD-endopeptidase MepM/ murein hydrolase activator NlpD
MPIFALSIVVPVTVQAGFFDFFVDLFKADAPNAFVSIENSQNINLLEAALNYDPNPSKGGGDITIIQDSALLPDAGPAGTLANIEEGGSDQISIYVVREGDSLSQIAQMFNVSINTIIWSNDIKRGSLITPGQTLAILPITGVQHKVLKGETLAGIVKKYKGHMEEVLQYNDLTEDAKLAVGDVVVIPDGEIAMPVYSSARRVVRGSGGPSYSGYYIRPIAGKRSQGLHGYNAIDLAAPAGTPIVAAASGSVILSKNYGWNGGYGKYVVIKHNNGTQTLYAHNSSNIVSQGQYVVQGQVIGYTGSTGKSTGPHVHFEVRGAKNPF